MMMNRLRTADQTLNQSEPDRDQQNQLKPAARMFHTLNLFNTVDFKIQKINQKALKLKTPADIQLVLMQKRDY